MKALLRLVYTSRPRIHFDDAGLAGLLHQSRVNNYNTDITGVLSFSHGFFLQVLEGPEREVISRYAKIVGDPRHGDCELLDIGLIQDRLFSNWTMGFVGGLKRVGGHYNEMRDYRIIRDDAQSTRTLLDALMEIITE